MEVSNLNFDVIKNGNYPDTLKSVQIVDVRAKLPTNPKYTWETLVSGGRKNGIRDMGAITTIVMHHDAIANSTTKAYSDLQLMTNIASSHIRSQRNIPTGDGGFPYHMYIRSGKAYICNNLTAHTFGVSSHNGYTVHICVAGNYTKDHDTLSAADRNALIAGIIFLEENLPAFRTIKAHSELDATSCPAYDYKKVRSDVQAIQLTASTVTAPNEDVVKITKVNSRINDLFHTATTEGKYQPLAQKYLLNLHDFMKESGLL
jgi:hypothetical protein